MPKSGNHNVNNIDSFFRVRPSKTNIREGETVSFLEDGVLVKQEKRNGVVYEQKFTELASSAKVTQTTGDVTNLIVAGSSSSEGDVTGITAGTGLSGGGSGGNITLNIDSTVTTLTGTQTLTNKTLTAPTLTTPALGTPASGVMTNVTGTAANLTVGNATKITSITNSNIVQLTATQTLTNKSLTAPTLTGTTQAANLSLSGDLTVGGTTTTLNAANLVVKDKNVVLNYLDGDSSATSDGAGITIQDAVNSSTDATILWDKDPGEFDFSHAINVTGNILTSGTVDGVDIAARDHDAVTLAGSLDYLTLSGQQITRNAINLTTDVTGTLPVGNGGTGATTLTSNSLLTGNGTSAIQAESGLTYDGSTLAVTGEIDVSDIIHANGNASNRLDLDDDSDSAQANQVTLAGANNVNILIDGTNNGTGDFQVRARPTTANDLDTASMILDMDKVTAVFNQDTSQQFQIGGANRLKILETGVHVQSGSLGVGIEPVADNGILQVANEIICGDGDGDIALTTNDGGGNANITFNHTNQDPDINGQSGRIHVNVDATSSEGEMVFETSSADVTGGATDVALVDSLKIAHDYIEVPNIIRHMGDTDTNITFTGDAITLNAGGETLLTLTEGSQDVVKLGDGGDVDINLNDDMFIQGSSSNVGIGTASPATKLMVSDDTAGSPTRISISNGGTAQSGTASRLSFYEGTTEKSYIERRRDNSGITAFHTPADNNPFIWTNATGEFMRFTNSNVGIGATSPGAKLHIKTPSSANADLFVEATDFTPTLRMYSGGTNVQPLIRFGTGSGSSKLRLQSITAGGGISGSVSDVMTLQENGNVGIGETSPEAKLHIKNASAGTFTASNSQLLIENNTTVRLTMVTPTNNASKIEFGDIDDQDAGILEYNNSDNSMRFTTNTSEAMRIDSAGNVAINQGNRFYLDGVAGSGDTYIQSDTADNLRFVVGNRNMIEMIEDDSQDMVVIGNGATDVDFIVEDDAGAAVLTVDSQTSKTTLHSLDVTNNVALGDVTADNVASNSFHYNNSGSLGAEAFTIGASGGVEFTAATAFANSLFESSSGGIISIKNTTGDIDTGTTLGRIDFSASDEDAGSDANLLAASIQALTTADFTASSNQTDLVFYTATSETATEKVRIKHNGRVGIGTDSPTYELDVVGDIGVSHVIYHNDDTNTYAQFTNDRIRLIAGGNTKVDTNETYITAATAPITALNDATANELVTVGSTTTELDAESNLTFDGTTLHIADGALTIDQDDANEGGEIRLLPGNSHSNTYTIDNFYGHLRFFASATAGEQFRLTSDGDLAQLTGTKHYFDGVGHTYITESANDLLDVYVGGTNLLRLEESGTDSVFTTDNVHLAVGTHKDLRIYHNGSSTNNNIENHSGSLYITNEVNDADIILRSDDGSGGVTPYLTLDGSASTTLLSQDTRLNVDNKSLSVGADNDLRMIHDGTSYLQNITATHFIIQNTGLDQDITFKVNDGGSTITALQIDASDTGTVRLPNDGQNLYIGQNNDIRLVHLSGTNYMYTYNGPFYLGAVSTDQDVFIRGNDGGASINAVQFDMSDAGSATFNHDVKVNDNGKLKAGSGNDFTIHHDGTNSYINNSTGHIYFTTEADDKNLVFRSDDGSGGVANYLIIDGGSSIITAHKNMRFDDSIKSMYGASSDLQVYHNGTNSFGADNYTGALIFQQRADDEDIIFKCDDGSGGVTAYITLDGSATDIKIAQKMQFPASHSADKIVMYSGGNEKIGTEANTLLFTADNYKFKDTAGHDNLFMNNSGNVGIGTTSPSKKFVVKGASGDIARFEHNGAVGSVDIYSGTDGGLLNVRNASGTSILELDGRSGNLELPYGRITDAGTDMNIVSDNALTLGTESGTALTIPNASTNVGIGTSSPSAKLDVVGDMTINGHITMQSGHYITAHNESSYQKYDMYAGNGAYCIGMYASNSYGGLNNDWAMTFTFNDDADRGFLWRDTAHGTGSGAMALTTNGKLSVAHSARIGYGETESVIPGATYALDVSGSIGATADVVAYVSSDKRLKDNIKNIVNPLEKLEKLNGVEFDWNDKQDLYKGHDIGVIAQEVEEVLPEIVETREDGHKAVKYDRMVALLIEAIKEQQKQIDELRKGNFVIETGD